MLAKQINDIDAMLEKGGISENFVKNITIRKNELLKELKKSKVDTNCEEYKTLVQNLKTPEAEAEETAKVDKNAAKTVQIEQQKVENAKTKISTGEKKQEHAPKVETEEKPLTKYVVQIGEPLKKLQKSRYKRRRAYGIKS